MLLKWLFTGAIVYVLYKYFFGPNALGSGKEEQRRQPIHPENPPQKKSSPDEEGEFIDYEEID
ncbi:MAG: hypothetical protein H6556_26420 [Lewinellaceae bacterium]|nr:hypothetical protein [Lewinellaceae bacterium]